MLVHRSEILRGIQVRRSLDGQNSVRSAHAPERQENVMCLLVLTLDCSLEL